MEVIFKILLGIILSTISFYLLANTFPNKSDTTKEKISYYVLCIGTISFMILFYLLFALLIDTLA